MNCSTARSTDPGLPKTSPWNETTWSQPMTAASGSNFDQTGRLGVCQHLGKRARIGLARLQRLFVTQREPASETALPTVRARPDDRPTCSPEPARGSAQLPRPTPHPAQSIGLVGIDQIALVVGDGELLPALNDIVAFGLELFLVSRDAAGIFFVEIAARFERPPVRSRPAALGFMVVFGRMRGDPGENSDRQRAADRRPDGARPRSLEFPGS